MNGKRYATLSRARLAAMRFVRHNGGHAYVRQGCEGPRRYYYISRERGLNPVSMLRAAS
jgi:hypothetical protein